MMPIDGLGQNGENYGGGEPSKPQPKEKKPGEPQRPVSANDEAVVRAVRAIGARGFGPRP